MYDVITAIITNLFRTVIIKRFLTVFFEEEAADKQKERVLYGLFFVLVIAVYLMFHFPPVTAAVNLVLIYLITLLYAGEQKKRILVSVLVYGINMACDILATYAFSDYVLGGAYNLVSAYLTVFLFSICEFIAERFLVRKKERSFTPPHGWILILIPTVSIIILMFMVVNNIENQMLAVVTSIGLLLINMLICYLYNELLETWLKLTDNLLLERQMAGYANQLEVLMQSEEKISALRHDMKHHLNELLLLAGEEGEEKRKIAEYIQQMQMFMENKAEYVSSGNKEVDSILNYMLGRAEQVLDRTEFRISIPKEVSIRPFDLNIIFGNLLENAITAAAASQEKRLSVLVKYEKGMLFVNIRNSFAGKTNRLGERWLTTKAEADGHGIGLQNVRKVVESYRGNMEISESDQIFDVKIMLYTLPERQETGSFLGE